MLIRTKKYLSLFCLLICNLNMGAQGIQLENIVRIDLSTLYGGSLCENCISPIAHIKPLDTNLYLYESGSKEVIHYDLKAHKAVKKIAVQVVNELLYQTPMFVDRQENVHFFVMQTNDRHHIANVPTRGQALPSLSKLTGVKVQDQHNITRNFSNIPTQNGICYLNIIRPYTNATKADYYKKLGTTPLACGFNVKKSIARAHPIHFYSPIPDGHGNILANNFWFFDVVQDKGCVFFQNKCSDTIYKYHIKNNTVKKIVPTGSQYEVKPIWYNPKNSDMGDILLKQNRTSCIYVDYNKGMIYRRLVINLPEGLKHVVQILNQDGLVLGEKLLDHKYEYLVRMGKDLYIYALEDHFFALYKVSYES